MKINIRYFASVREQIGISSEEVETLCLDLNGLRDELISKGDNYRAALSQGKAIRMAMNQVVCDGDLLLKENAEVAFFPPVTGG